MKTAQRGIYPQSHSALSLRFPGSETFEKVSGSDTTIGSSVAMLEYDNQEVLTKSLLDAGERVPPCIDT